MKSSISLRAALCATIAVAGLVSSPAFAGTLIAAAGGGGGAGYYGGPAASGGQVANNGQDGGSNGAPGGTGGTAGSGGTGGTGNYSGGGGAGYVSSGTAGSGDAGGSGQGGSTGDSFAGGAGATNGNPAPSGGYGGGGGGGFQGGGGGGGYSGGGGGDGSSTAGAGGGGSFVSDMLTLISGQDGANGINNAGGGAGSDGYVTINDLTANSSTTFTFTGSLQFYTFASTGLYEIILAGAQGGGGQVDGGGYGALLDTSGSFTAGSVLDVLVGGAGLTGVIPGAYGGGGGGGTFLTLEGDAPPAAVPEPASWALMVGGFGLLGGALRRNKVSVRFA